MQHLLVNNPVQKLLGAIDSGAYQPAAVTKAHTFKKVEDMWSDPIDKSEVEEEAATPTMPKKSAEEPPARRTGLPTRSHVLHQLYQIIYQSHDNVCFFAHQRKGQTTEIWYLIQVNLNKTDPLLGTLDDPPPCGLSIQIDRCMPVLASNHVLITDPLQPYGKIVPVQPGRQDAVLKHTNLILYEGKVDLSGLLHK
jgi:hypothetical protein